MKIRNKETGKIFTVADGTLIPHFYEVVEEESKKQPKGEKAQKPTKKSSEEAEQPTETEAEQPKGEKAEE